MFQATPALLLVLLEVGLRDGFEEVFSVLLLAYSFWSPAVLVPLAAALLGVRCDGRVFRRACVAGCAVCLLWTFAWGKPWGIDGCLPGILANLVVFAVGVRRQHRYCHTRLRFSAR